MSRPTIDDVKAFWENNPLWMGESRYKPGTREFFEEHASTVVDDCFAGQLDERIFADINKDRPVLDLGCGPGFWTIEFGRRGFKDITACDLTENALELTRRRCEVFGVNARFVQGNAEQLPFRDGEFQHVNCQGVVHHTPQPRRAIAEIARILAPGGTASVSVYYKNFILRNWSLLRPLSKLALTAGSRLKGRGREQIFGYDSVDEIVRIYDGKENPIGVAYDENEYRSLIGDFFEVKEVYLHFFPLRALPIRLGRTAHQVLDRKLGFMIYGTLLKK